MSAAIALNERPSLPLTLVLASPTPGALKWDDHAPLAALKAGRYYDPDTQVNALPAEVVIEMRKTRCTGICGTGIVSDIDQVNDD